MELREKIALAVHSWHCPDEASIVTTYWSGPTMQDYLECADQILALTQGEWLDQPDSEGWWWFKDNNKVWTIRYFTGAIDFISGGFSKWGGLWCKAIVPEIGEVEK